MYQADNKSNILKTLLRIVLFILLVLLVFKLFTLIINNKKKKDNANIMDTNLNSLQDTGVKYFKENKIDLKVGKNKTIYLNELIDNNLISELKDESDNSCSKEESYIEILRLENEYRIKSYLVCGDKKNDKYIYIDSISGEVKKDQEPTSEVVITVTTDKTTKETTTTKKTTTTTTTKKTTRATTKVTTRQTTKKVTKPQGEYYTVGFNTNGGELIASIKVRKGESIVLPTPVYEGHTFYRWIDSSNNVYSGTITPTKNLVLIAKWR